MATPVAFDSDQRFVPLKDELARPPTAQYGPIDRVTDAPATRGFKSRVRSDIASRPVPPRVDELTDETGLVTSEMVPAVYSTIS